MFKTILPSLIMVALVLVPMAAPVVAVMYAKRREARAQRRSPLNDRVLHQAGYQARRKADELSEDLVGKLIGIMLVGPLLMLTILLPRVNWSALRLNWVNGAVIVLALGVVIWLTQAILRLRADRQKWRQGMLAEIAVAQQLDGLQAQGCHVVHDVPADGFNLDHVVIGDAMVFAVETKSRLKPGQGKAAARVQFDGKALQFPGWLETKPLEQARAQARWLAKYLRDETGEAVAVTPVLCLPGWWVEQGKDAHRSDVRVINPKMLSLFKSTATASPLPLAQRNRIVHALRKRFPELPD